MKQFFKVFKNKVSLKVFYLILFGVLLSAKLIAQQPGNALKFDGANDYVQLPNALATISTLTSNNGITIEYWFKGSSLLSAVRIQNTTGYIVAGYGMQHIISTDGATSGVAIPAYVQDGRWHHIAMTWQKNTTNGFKSYVDGQLVAQRTSANVSLPTINTGAYLGTYNTASEFTNGSLDEVKIYNTAITQANIQFDMVNSTSQVPLSLLAYYNFNAGTSGGTNTSFASVRDTSGRGYHGTATNFALTGTGSNYMESYAMVVPTANAATGISSTGFTANWSAPIVGTVNNYLLDVSTNEDFTGMISGSPFTVASTSLSQNIAGLISGTYYYRVRANKTSVDLQGVPSNVRTVTVPYIVPGNALAFDGSNDFVSLPNGIVNGLTNTTIEAWFNLNNSNQWQRVFDFGSGTAKYILFTPTAGANGKSIAGLPYFEIYNGSVTQHINGNKPLIIGKWYHIAITINNASSIGRMYINGELVGENTTMTFKPSDIGITTQNWLGRSQYSVDAYLNGKIDEFRIWNVTRTQAEIQAGMRTFLPVNTTGLISYYNFDQGVASLNNSGITTLTNSKDSTQINTLNNFTLTGTSSNWVESYALAIPTTLAPSSVSTSGFTANWTAPSVGIVNNYFVDVATDANFINLISGSPFTISGNTTFSRNFTGLQSNLNYYYRVRADRTFLTGQGGVSSTIIARTLNAVTPPGNCLAMDGTDDYLTIPATTSINNQFANNRITVETWAYLKSLPTNTTAPALITEGYNGAGGNNIKFALFLHDNKLYGGFHPGSWTHAIYTKPLPLNRWLHIACTYDQNQIKLYVNGDLVATQNSTAALPDGNEEWRIGRRWDLNDCINGSMDEVRIYNEALTQSQIQSDMRDTTSALPYNLVAYYNFDQGNAGNTNTGISLLTDKSSSTLYNSNLNNFALTGTNSNFIASYALVVPTATAATAITTSGFTVNWLAPRQGIWNNYLLDVSTSSDFTGPVVGSPFTLSTSTFSQAVTGLLPGTYYYRVRAINTNFANQSAVSNTIAVLVNYATPGNALAFDGSGDVVVTPISTSYIDNFTMEAWVKPNILTGDWQTIFAYGFDNGQYGNGVALYIHPSNGRLYIQYPAVNTVDLGVKIDLNRWSHVAMTRSLNGVVRVYVNGEVLAVSGTNNPNGITGEVRIGGHTGIRFLNGKIDEFRFWSPVRTQAQIQASMRNSVPTNSSGLLIYYKFDQGVSNAINTSTNVVLDQTVSGNNGSMPYFTLSSTTSNWTESYGLISSFATNATSITSSGFTANWTAPLVGTINNYYLEVSTTSDFTGPITGSPFVVGASTFSRVFTNMLGGTYYYRVSASKTNMANQGAYSNIITVAVPYTPPGNALAFDGENDFAHSLSTNTGNFGTGDFTVEYWIKTTAASAYHITKRGACGGGSFWSISHGNIWRSDNREIQVEVNNGGGYPIVLTPILAKPINDGRWHHIALVRQGVKAILYINGEVVSSGTSNGVANVSNGGYMYLGTSTCGTRINGSFDEVRLWNVARSADSINAAMRRTLDPNTPGINAYYDFDQGVGGLINYGRNIVFEKKGINENNLNLVDFSLEALNTNYVQSYATVVPTQIEPTAITPTGFTLNWVAPPNGVVTNYLVDVSLSSNFTAPISGSPFSVTGLSYTLSGLASSTFYCRVRANNSSSSVLSGEGGPSNVKVVDLKYVQPGNALKLDGSNDYGTITKNVISDFTIEYWVKTGQTGNTGTHFYQGNGIVNNESSTGDFGTSLVGNKLAFGVNETTIMSNTSINTDKWFHIAVTRNNSTGLLRIYINGNLETNATGNTGNLNASNVITLGAVNGAGGNSSYSFNGTIDELRIWNVERTGSEISTYYKDTVARNTTGLVDYYRFDQGIGGANNTGVTTLKDIAGIDNSGSITNFSLSGTSSNWVNAYNISVNPPNTLTASSASCGTIDLNWQIPSTPSSNCETSTNCDGTNFKQYIYVDDSLLAIVASNISSYSFNVNQIYGNTRLIRGVNYKFVVRTAYTPPFFNFIKTSLPTNIAIGRFKDNPTMPSGFTASLDKCDGSVTLNWTWNEANPQNGFVVNRSLDSAMTSPVVLNFPGTQRSYNDPGLQRGQLYYYRIFARNDCYSSTAVDSMYAGISDSIIIVGGISPQVPARPTNVSLFSDSINNVITIRWKDNATNEDKYVIERSAIGGLTTNIDANANDTVYIDDQAAGCTAYNYTVKAISGCAVNGIPSLGLNQTRITPNLARTFDDDTTIYKLTCSKGYYKDRVELNWNNRNNAQLNSIRIYRKVANSNNDSNLIASVLSGSGLYIDNTIVAGVLYRYYLIGETQCAGVTRYSNITTDIGFRSPTGTVNGRVSYLGDFAAQGVRVLAQNTTNNKGGGINLDGVNDYLEIKHNSTQNTMTNALTIEAWYKPLAQNNFVIVNKKDSANGGYNLTYDKDSNNLIFAVYNATDSQIVKANNPFVSFTSYNQITATFGTDSIRIYVNGLNATTVVSNLSYLGMPTSNIYLGGSPELGIYGTGNLDEVRLWKKAKTKTEIQNDFNRKIDQDDANLFAYLSFDDRFNGLTETYDLSNLNLVFNSNHAKLRNGATFTDSIPNFSQLANASYSDANGNYTIPNLRYIGSGQNYTIVPSLDIHTFSPNNSIIFVGDGNQLVNNINFTDNSSFEFVGTVRYAGTTCPARGAYVMIDGQFTVQNNQILTVNDSGKFVIRVPIGNHFISLSQNKHTFSEGRFPETGLYDFRGPVSANFVDSTFVTVIGRVAGGNRELNKLPGLGRGKNNIGKAQFTFNSVGQSGINGCFSRNITTNDSTGEYKAYLLPLRYNINGLKLVNNADPTVLTKTEFNNPNILDLTSIPDSKSTYDTLVTPLFTRVDSVVYNTQLDFKYFETPQIFVTDTNTPFLSLSNNFVGEKSIKINDTTTISIANNEFGYPVFLQGNDYVAVVKVIEKYTNIDKPVSDITRTDIVPVSGTLRFFNNLSLNDTTGETSIDKGIFIYPFKGGVPNQLRNTTNPQYSYTKTFQLEFIPEIGATINWLPNQADLINKFFRGYAFGSRPGGSNFTTRGPALVDFILRDPPGSASSATWSKGTAITKAESYNFSQSYTSSFNNVFDLGGKVTTFVGAGAGLGAFFFGGVLTETETIFNVGLGVTDTRTNSAEGEILSTITNTTTISTGSDPSSVGTKADIYYGKSSNLIFGNADVVELIDTATCIALEASLGVPACIGNEINGYKIGKKNGYFISPGGIATTFAYTQDEILSLIIPDLEALRNQLFTNNALNNKGQRKYNLVFSNNTDPLFARKFGSNNDDPIWGSGRSSPTPYVREARDTTGLSYTFRGNNRFETDSVRFFNDQIRLWKQAIAKNEKEKYLTINNSGATPVSNGRNISIGKASLTQDFSTDVEETNTESFEVSLGVDVSLTVGFELFSIGNEFTSSFSFERTSGASRSNTKAINNTFSYTLQDGDDGDLISVDIVDPKSTGSHIFKLRAGRTACPYEGEQKAMFYDPANDTITSTTLLEDGFEVQTATAQNDVPVISVDRNSNFNVPAADDAIFILDLGNLSEGRQDRTYSLRVDPASNPYGAILKVDGLDPNRDFDVPYGTTVQKTLTLKRGPNHYDFNDIKLILKSACDDDIFDEVTISAKFLPTCTDITMKSPDDRWVLNSSFNDTLPVVLGGYNYNWGGFEAVHFQYKPGGTNVWYNEKSYFKDTADNNVKIPLGEPTIFYPFNFKNLPDGNYELRATTECIAPGYPNSRINSSVMQGLVDRINPSPFGTPSPADGILSPNDDISIQFNEPIEQSALSLSNFEVKGVLNKSDLKSNTSILFDGDNDYLEVPQGLNLQLKPFTIEFWHKRNALGNQVIISQGADTNASFDIGFTADNKFYCRIAGEIVVSNVVFTDTTSFNFFAVSYNNTAQTADLFINEQVVNIGNNRIFNPYTGSGKLFMGKAAIGVPKYTKGHLYEVRIWNIARTLTESIQTKSKLLSGTESGLIGNWRMDEATGTSVKDYARFRNALMVNAQWFLLPMGKSYSFDGNGDFITVPTQHFGISKEMDFTLEFWFKGNNGNKIGLLSNGTGEANATNPNLKWSIETDSIGRIIVKHNGVYFAATNTNYFDGNWHHLALVLRRNSSLSCYVDANIQNSIQSGSIEQWGGLKLWFGAKGWNNNGNLQFDSTSNYFTGQLDDLRFWNTSRLIEQITRDKNNRLNGDEAGLVLYVPFEAYTLQQGFPVLNPSTRDFTSTNRTFTSFGDAAISNLSPTIKLPRAAQNINFTYALNGDRIIITPTTANEFIENVTLDITVKNIKDKNGNTMQSPKTWIAYIDKNQVKWQDDSRIFDKAPGAPLSFQATIINSGGASKTFTISNLPAWLTASTTNATINPSSSYVVTFTVDPNLNIGKYEQDLALTTDFGFADKLLIKLNVNAIAPNWVVTKSAYSKSMSIIGQVRINNVISANTDDILGAFVGNVCRGVGKVQYYEKLDKYLVFMDVYGNVDNEGLSFKIWNSATGKTHIQVDPSLNFVSNNVIGTVAAPQIFNALDKVTQHIALNPGWNWISVNLLSTDSANLNQLFGGLKPSSINQIKNNSQMASFDSLNGWTGSLANINAGVKPEQSYLLKVAEQDTLEIRGVEANPSNRIINITSGWNYIGFVSQRNLSTNEALANWEASQNDVIKGQTNFAVYDTVLGWIGSLSALIPNEGYLYKSAKNGTFTYPRSAMFGKKAIDATKVSSAYWNINPYQFNSNMNIIGKVNACSNLLAKDQLLLGAFVNNQLRGFAKPQTTNVNDNTYFLTIAGNENEAITFKLLDETTGNVFDLNQNLSYKTNAINGSVVNPVVFSNDGPCIENKVANAVNSKVYPVPFTEVLSIEFNLPQAEKVNVRVMDISGKEIGSIASETFGQGANQLTWKAGNLPAGVYIIEIETNSKTIRHKVVKL